jgi:F420-dependent oxidoreductase-like protein
MRLSLGVEGQEGLGWDDFLAVGATAERAGIESLFRSDHFSPILGGPELEAPDAWASLAALAARTERLRLGTLVSPVAFRHPSVLARTAATVDRISAGRVVVGLGAGWYEAEHARHGFVLPTARVRFDRFAEYLEIVVRSWTGESFDFAGEHWTLTGCRALPKPVQQPHPPLLVGGAAGPRAAALAARWAQEYNSAFATVDECRERRARLDAACRESGRDPATLTFSIVTRCIVGEDRSEVGERLRRVQALDGSFAPAESWLVGTVDELATQLAALEDTGVGHVVLHHLDHRDLAMIELIGRDLVPAVR